MIIHDEDLKRGFWRLGVVEELLRIVAEVTEVFELLF